jgi:thiamine-phosphate pyrophosphorylase
MKPLRGLYAITPPDHLSGVEAALASGAVCALQYRAKEADAPRRLSEARQLAQLCRAHGVPLIVNDDLELALAVDAAGVHLGRDDGALALARARLHGRLLGASCYDRPEVARRAVAAGADYVAFGSVFDSPTKPAAVRASRGERISSERIGNCFPARERRSEPSIDRVTVLAMAAPSRMECRR